METSAPYPQKKEKKRGNLNCRTILQVDINNLKNKHLREILKSEIQNLKEIDQGMYQEEMKIV